MDYNAIFPSWNRDVVTCEECGAVFSVNYSTQAGHNEREEYRCPECSTEHFIRASLQIMNNDIQLITGRTDGRTGRIIKED